MPLDISFIKYQGCGNDFIVISELEGERIPERTRGELSRILCQRAFSVGANGILYVVPSDVADARMRLFNPDGSEAEMCGNGIRCVADHIRHETGKRDVSIETMAGVKRVVREGDLYRVDMGTLAYKKSDQGEFVRLDDVGEQESLLERKLSFPGLGELTVSIVNTGEPHLVIFVDDVDAEEIDRYGEAISSCERFFPRSVNVNLAQVLGASTLKVRTYERGVWEETLACGTGATACAAVAHATNRTVGERVKVKCRGGDLTIEVLKDGLVMIGPAKRVYAGRATVELGSRR